MKQWSEPRIAATLVAVGLGLIGGALWLAEDSNALLGASVSRIQAVREGNLLAAVLGGIGVFLAALGSLLLMIRLRGHSADVES